MANLDEAYATLKTQNKNFNTLDYFFSQRTLTEEQEYIDKNMNRKTKKIKVTYNFLAINIPTIITSTTSTGNNVETSLGFDIEIFGDEGYHYKGTISSHQGIIPNFMIPIKTDKRLFVNVNYNFSQTQDNKIQDIKIQDIKTQDIKTKRYVNFIDVPKRFQNVIEDELKEKDNDSVVGDNFD
jgi:hypothetical protein